MIIQYRIYKVLSYLFFERKGCFILRWMTSLHYGSFVLYWSGLKMDGNVTPQPPLSGGLQSETSQLKKSKTVFEPEVSNQTNISGGDLKK